MEILLPSKLPRVDLKNSKLQNLEQKKGNLLNLIAVLSEAIEHHMLEKHVTDNEQNPILTCHDCLSYQRDLREWRQQLNEVEAKLGNLDY